MAYSGFLLKIGDYTFPHKYIRADSYSAYDNTQHIDPWADSDGYEHLNAVLLKAIKVEFETPAMLTNTQLAEIMQNISANYIKEKDRTVMVTAYIPFIDDYVTQVAYLADPTPSIYGIFKNVIKYNPIRFAFIGGVASD